MPKESDSSSNNQPKTIYAYRDRKICFEESTFSFSTR